MQPSMTSLGIALVLALSAGCADDPMYIQPAMALEVGVPDSMVSTATQTIMLPIALETELDAAERALLAAELGVDVPYVKLDDLSISIEWTIKNLADGDAEARIGINGANEYFAYIPLNFVVDPEEDEEPPPLAGDIPYIIGPNETRSGVFREDQLREAAIDLDLITRGALNPFAAVLQNHEDITELDAGGVIIPRSVFPNMVQFDLTFDANAHMVLEYTVRVRDHRGILHDELLSAPPEELTAFAPAIFVPPPPPMN